MAEKDAVAQAYRTINEADPDTAKQIKRLKYLHKKTGEDPERAEAQIADILEGGPGAADRLRATADAVAKLWDITEEEEEEE